MKYIHSKNIHFKMAVEKDRELIQHLLTECNLPCPDIDLSKQYFIIADDDEKMIGCCGFEICGENGLFRSLAVSPDYRNLRIGRLLTDKIINFAPGKGICKFYLLTTTASPFFTKQGWKETDRMNVPMEISRTTEFMTICPSTAICMMFNLEPVKS